MQMWLVSLYLCTVFPARLITLRTRLSRRRAAPPLLPSRYYGGRHSYVRVAGCDSLPRSPRWVGLLKIPAAWGIWSVALLLGIRRVQATSCKSTRQSYSIPIATSMKYESRISAGTRTPLHDIAPAPQRSPVPPFAPVTPYFRHTRWMAPPSGHILQ